jgi:glycosyltransferase involved in cell wall biosynthesis
MSTAPPLVSIVIPCRDYGHFLHEAIQSVRDQTYAHWEIVIADDGSSRDTVDIIRTYAESPEIRALFLSHGGPSRARNRAIAAARGTYILPLDADDKIGPEYLRQAVALLEADPRLAIVTCQAEYFGAMSGRWELPDYAFPDILLGNCIFVTSLFRRADWETVGGFDETLRDEWEDFDFWLKLIERGGNVHRIPEVHFFYRRGHTSRASKGLDELTPLYVEMFKRHQQLYTDNIDILFRGHINHALLLQQCTAAQGSAQPAGNRGSACHSLPSRCMTALRRFFGKNLNSS